MAHDHVQDWDNPQEKDFNYNWVNSSSFLFYLQVFLFRLFLWVAATASIPIATKDTQK